MTSKSSKDKWSADLEARLRPHHKSQVYQEASVTWILAKVADIVELNIASASEQENYIIIATYTDGVALQSTYSCRPYFLKVYGDSCMYKLRQTAEYDKKESDNKFSND